MGDSPQQIDDCAKGRRLAAFRTRLGIADAGHGSVFLSSRKAIPANRIRARLAGRLVRGWFRAAVLTGLKDFAVGLFQRWRQSRQKNTRRHGFSIGEHGPCRSAHRAIDMSDRLRNSHRNQSRAEA